jgi:hypothetical protein
MEGYSGNIAVPGGQIGSGEAQVFNPMPTLGVLEHFANRKQQDERLAAMERMKMAALKQKAEKPIDYPEFDIKGSGGLFRKMYNDYNSEENLKAIDKIRRANGDPYTTAMVSTQRKNEMDGMNSILSEQEARVGKVTEDLRKEGYVVDQDRELHPMVSNAKALINPNLVNEYANAVKTNPRNFNFAQVGDEAEKIAGKVKRKTILSDGTEGAVEFPVFMRPSKKNPYVTELSVKDAVPVLLQTPGGRQQFPVLVTQSLKEQGIDPTVIEGKDVDALTDIQKRALHKAQTQAVEKYFAGRGDFSIVQDFNTDESKAKNTQRGTRLGDTQTGQRTTNAVAIRSPQGTITEAYIKGSTPLNSPKVAVGLPAGTVVYPTGYYGDAEQVTSGKIEGSQAKVLKGNVTAKNFIEAERVPVALERLTLPNGTVVEKGTVIADAINDPSLLKNISQGMYMRRNGYFAAPDDTQLIESVDENDVVRVKRAGPNSTSLLGTVFIPEESAGSIRTHFNRSFKKPAAPVKFGTKKY